MSEGVRFTFTFSPSTTLAITHLVNDLMSFPFKEGVRYQSADLHTMERRGYRRYNGNIQWRHTMETNTYNTYNTDDTMETYNGDQYIQYRQYRRYNGNIQWRPIDTIQMIQWKHTMETS